MPRADAASAFGAALLGELGYELPVTRRVLERVPSERGTWKPHAKSFSIAHLAQLVSWMPGWLAQTASTTELDLAQAGGYSNESTASLLESFDQAAQGAQAALAKLRDEDLDVAWSLKRGPQVLFTAPRRVVLRQHLNHLIHHRGQLSVYLRLLDVPVPSIYGPTADERM